MGQVRTLDLHGGVLQFRLLRVRIECAERERIRAVGVQDVAAPVHRDERLARPHFVRRQRPQHDLAAAVAGGADLATLQETLKCGTSCGSCVPELRRMVAAGAAT